MGKKRVFELMTTESPPRGAYKQATFELMSRRGKEGFDAFLLQWYMLKFYNCHVSVYSCRTCLNSYTKIGLRSSTKTRPKKYYSM